MLRLRVILMALLVVAVGLTARYLVPVRAYFSDTETASGSFSAGTWEVPSPVKICCICPCWGLAGSCRWPVFIYGEGFREGAVAELLRGGGSLPAVKCWVLGPHVIYAVFDLRGAGEGVYDLRVTLASGERGTLSQCFTVLAPGCKGMAAPLAQREGLTGGKNIAPNQLLYEGYRLVCGMSPDPANPGTVVMTLVGDDLGDIGRAYAAAPGVFVEGRIVASAPGSLSVAFDLRGMPAGSFDVVLFGADDRPVLLEGVTYAGEVRSVLPVLPAMPVPPVTPDSQAAPEPSASTESSATPEPHETPESHEAPATPESPLPPQSPMDQEGASGNQ